MRLVLTLLLLPLTAFGTLTVTPSGTVAGPNSAQGSTAFSPTSTIAAGSTGVLIIAADNAGGTVAEFPTGDQTDSIGNIWRLRLDRNSSAGVNVGAELAIYTCSKLVTQMTSSDSLTITYTQGNVTSKAYQFYQVSAGTGNIALPLVSAGASSSTATPTITTGPTIATNDLVIAADSIENNGLAVTADTTNNTGGSWSTQLAVSAGGATTSGIQIVSQYKVTSAVATQTYAPSWGAANDQTIGYLAMTEVDQKCRRVVSAASATTSFAVSPSDPLAIGSLGVMVFAVDNSGSAGSTANINSAVAGTPPGQGAGSILGTTGFDSVNNAWTERVTGINVAGGQGNGAEQAIFTAPITTALTTADSITVNFGASTTPKAVVLWEFAAATTPTYVTGVISGSTSTGTPSVNTTSSIPAGDIIIGGGAAEGGNTWVDATDTTGGNWSKGSAVSQGTGLAAQSVLSQYKISTGGVITFNPTLTAADVNLGWIQIHPPGAGPTAAQKSAFFMLFP